MEKYNPLKLFCWPFITIRAKSFCNLLCPFIKPQSTVLDVGAGNMLISKYLMESIQVQVQGIDIIDMNLTHLPHKLFDGAKIPFKDNSFEISLLIGVLHHVANQKELLNDVKRVTSSKVIVFEDTYQNNIEKTWVRIRDIIGNLPEEVHMNFALNFRTETEWNSFFKDVGLNIEFQKSLYNPVRLTHHLLYILTPE
jgi:2-polyprenyl-3-methyl-5-hydroxy-6-metoxy-1,4-benzoquinol methylase